MNWPTHIKTFSSSSIVILCFILFGMYVAPVFSQTAHHNADINQDGFVDLTDYSILSINFLSTNPNNPRADIDSNGIVDLTDYSTLAFYFLQAVPQASPTSDTSGQIKESMAMMSWGNPNGKGNQPLPEYDYCEDGTNVVEAHKQYHVVAYDGYRYPTWHPPTVTNPITGNGKCYFGHEHGTNPQGYIHWDEMIEHFGKDLNGDGVISPLVINADGTIASEGDRAGIPFGIAAQHMEIYYNQEGHDSIFVRHEDHVGHKIEFVNMEADMVGNTTHPMAQLPGTVGINVPYYQGSNSNVYSPTGVVCTHLHKFHQGTHSGDAILNNLHEVIFHSTCMSVDVPGVNATRYYPDNSIILTGMMAFGNPGEYKRFCFAERFTTVCGATGAEKQPGQTCPLNDPLLEKMPPAVNSNSLGRNMVDRYCGENWSSINPGNNFFAPYEIWEGDLAIVTPDGRRVAEHGRQWDVLDPVRFIDPEDPRGYGYNSEQCASGGIYDGIQYIGGCNPRNQNRQWNSPQSGFRGLKRTTYFGRNKVNNPGGPEIYWTDPLGSNAVPTEFSSGLKQKISPVRALICDLPVCSTLNDRAIQRTFDDGGGTVHAPN